MARGQTAVQHRPHSPYLAPPRAAGERGVDKQSARRAQAGTVALHQVLEDACVGVLADGPGRVVPQRLDQAVEAGFILDIQLQHPGRIVELRERLAERGLDRIAQCHHERTGTRFRADRGQVEQGADADPVLQQKALAVRQVFHPR